MTTFGEWLLKIRDEEIWLTTGAESFEAYLVEDLPDEIPSQWNLTGDRLAEFVAAAIALAERRRRRRAV